MSEKISKYSNLSKSELDKINDEFLQQIYFIITKFEKEHKGLKDLFEEDSRIGLSLSNLCDKGCVHCIAESTLAGGIMDFDKLKKVPEQFFRIFSHADYGRSGDPMLYRSNGSDLSDVIGFLSDYGIKNHTIASGIFANAGREHLIKRIRKVKDRKNLDIESMLTFHLYYPSLDNDTLPKVFNKSIRNLAKISDRIVLAIIGDTYFEDTSISSALDLFYENIGIVFDGFDTVEKIGDKLYSLKGKEGDTEIEIRSNPAIYPYGRFEKYLKGKGVYEDYVNNFPFGTKPILCPDVGEWPGILIEYDGGINLCGSFEAIATKETVIGNIFGKTYGELESLLFDFYNKEKEWFIKNIDNLLLGKKSTCKVFNKCYEL